MTTTILHRGHKIHCQIEGEGPPLILLHGWPTNSLLWSFQVESLKKTHRVITYDAIGFGRSDKPANYNYTFTAAAEVLQTVIKQLVDPAEKVSLAGHDMGGPPTVLWAAANQERVANLIMLNTVFYTLRTPLDATSEFIMAMPLLQQLFVSPFGLNLVMRTNVRSGRQGLKDSVRNILEAYSKEPYALKLKTIRSQMHHGRAFELKTLAEKFAAITAPKHLIIAKQDPLCYAHISKLSKANPSVPVYEIEKCGHFMQIDQPAAVTEAFEKILHQPAT